MIFFVFFTGVCLYPDQFYDKNILNEARQPQVKYAIKPPMDVQLESHLGNFLLLFTKNRDIVLNLGFVSLGYALRYPYNISCFLLF